jgi:hypothetical protein
MPGPLAFGTNSIALAATMTAANAETTIATAAGRNRKTPMRQASRPTASP